MKAIKQNNQAVVIHRSRLTGIVVSNKLTNTIVVNVVTVKMNAKYKKQYKLSRKYKAHVLNKDNKIGDVVVIEACRPMSRDKRWRVVSKVK
jgi:small subunit ribosomal protein S17